MSSLSERIYFASPIWLQQLAVSSYGWLWYRRRMSRHFYRLVAEYQSRDNWTREQFLAYQEKQLLQLLETADGSPYYQAIFRVSRVDWQLPAFKILAGLPFLSKETLRTRARDLVTQNPVPNSTSVFKSSGTTGTPTEIYYSPEFHALELAVPAVRNLGWAGVSYHSRRVMFGVRKVCRFDQDKPPFWRFSPAEDLAYASVYHLSPKNIPAYLDFLRTYRPDMIMGYPSALHTIAQYAMEHNDKPAPAKAIFTTSETVTEGHRQTIESAWQCKIYDRYGAVEGCMLAFQCEHGRYHVSPEVGIIEIVNTEGYPCSLGELGEVVCTGLQNLLQPLIRYRTGDVARWAIDQTCPCGRQMPILELIEGRVEDICITSDGRQMLRFDTVFKGVENIREAQVVQEQLDLFTICLVPADTFEEHDIQKIKDNMRLHAGEVRVDVHLVDQIERTASGKFRAVICKLRQDEKDRVLNRVSE
ncbi:MAG: phenylacetate--CoA ligase family protein [Planctomycetes bacterium]|nr:phenylacetate--CoA ligase family protein [Planctomycetota bacterium]MBI5965723.1 phenylacetate--CoA ligase family protein [Chloroflexota bacterium]